MKKFFEKYDLIKLSGILILLSVVLTWVVPYGYYYGNEMYVEEITRVGLNNFFQYGLLGMYYFTVLVTFLFVLGGFYQVLSKAKGYQALVKSISKKLEGHEVPFVIAVSFVLAAVTSLSNEYFPLIALIPFIITILNRLKVDKLSAFSATFGALLVGTIGSIYSNKVTGYLVSTFNDSCVWARIVLFALAFILLTVFNIIHISKTRKKKQYSDYDKFEIVTVDSGKEKVRKWPYVVCLVLFVLTVVLAYLPWERWNVSLFANITDWFNKISIFRVPIISYITGNLLAFGTWDIFTIQFVMIIATILIHWFGKISLSDVFESYGEGFKKMSYVVVVLLFVYAILEFAVMFPVVPVIVDWISGLSKGFNVVLTSLSAIVASIFGVEMQYVMNLAGTYFAGTYANHVDALAIIFQSMFGLVSFCVPSSAILMIGLAYLGISYKEWMKYIWKFLLAMLAVVIILLAVLLLFVL